MREIILRNRKKEVVGVALVDDADYEVYGKYRWHLNSRGYAARRDSNHRLITLHREIMQPPPDMQIDHRDGDKLNNQRANLRVCSHWENRQNTGGFLRETASDFIGVDRNQNKWRARIKHNGKLMHVDLFDSEIEAARARDAKALELRGEFARLNFNITQTELRL